MSSFKLHTKKEYVQRIINFATDAKAGDTVLVMTMAFDVDESTVVEMMDALVTAAKNGVNVTLIVDAYAFLNNGAAVGPLFYRKGLDRKLPRAYQRRLDALTALQDAGGRFVITNLPAKRFSNPFAGRSHIKLAVLNDHVFVGGCNINDMDHRDLMVEWRNAHVAQKLLVFGRRVVASGRVNDALHDHDHSITLDGESTLLIDSGAKGRSVIFDTALDLILAAKTSITLVCQFFPDSITTRALLSAHKKGVAASIVHNHPSKHSFPFSALHRGVSLRQKRIVPRAFFNMEMSKSSNFVHAKILIVDDVVMTGSHNFVNAGVKLGTAEMTLLSRNKKLLQDIQKFVELLE